MEIKTKETAVDKTMIRIMIIVSPCGYHINITKHTSLQYLSSKSLYKKCFLERNVCIVQIINNQSYVQKTSFLYGNTQK